MQLDASFAPSKQLFCLMQASVNPVASGGAQQSVQTGHVYGIGHHGSSSAIAYGGPYMPYSSSTIQSNNNQQEHGFPERPGQPECQYYMRTGDCKFGATCKYHHPRDWSSPKSNYMFSPFCLPLRPVSNLNTSFTCCRN
jgi:hypothetical protein